MYNFLKDNENRVKTLLGSSLTTQYWDTFMNAVSESGGTFTNSETFSASLALGQYESGSDISWFIEVTGSLDS